MNDEDVENFKKVVEQICANARTYYPVTDRPFYVQTDASYFCAGGRLFQKNDEGGEMLIAAVSRTFTRTERNYTIYKKEALALLYTLRSMDFFLKYAPKLILIVDAKALIYIRLAKEGAPILLRFSLELSKYDAELIHVPGKQNVVADVLSRQNKEIPEIELEKLDRLTITERDTIKIIDALTMPDEFHLTKSELFSLLNGPSPIDDSKQRKITKSKAMPGTKQVKNTPVTLNKRKIKMPRTEKVKLAKMTTRSMTKPKVTFQANPTYIPDVPVPKENIENKIIKTNDQTVHTEPEIENKLDSQESINYSDVNAVLKTTTLDKISPEQFSEFQILDDRIRNLVDNKSPSITIINEMVYQMDDDKLKLILPECLYPVLINLHHFLNPGIHKTRNQIVRDIKSMYCISKYKLLKQIDRQIKNCHICQIFQDGKQNLRILNLPRFGEPRLSWSIDLITDLPMSVNMNKILLIAVDDFANYILAIPIASTSTKDLIKAVKEHIINPFGIPKFIRSDEQPGIYNSKEFFTFFSDLNIELQATAVASPFSNGRAEVTIKIFKQAARKYFYQHKCIDKWDEHAPLIAAAINTSTNSYGYAPEEIMFGNRLEHNYALTDIFSGNNENSVEQVIESLIVRAQNIRQKYDSAKLTKQNKNTTFRNKKAPNKIFEPGMLVLHRQLQVSTGTASKYRPLFTGPYVVTSTDGVTATCQDLRTNRVIKAHFHNLANYEYDEGTIYGANVTPEGAGDPQQV
jgi:hypothetical protein